MTTKHVLLFLGGAAVGFFLCKYMHKCPTATTTAAVDPKQAQCEAQLADAMKLTKFATAEATEQYKTQFMADCMAAQTPTA